MRRWSLIEGWDSQRTTTESTSGDAMKPADHAECMWYGADEVEKLVSWAYEVDIAMRMCKA